MVVEMSEEEHLLAVLKGIDLVEIKTFWDSEAGELLEVETMYGSWAEFNKSMWKSWHG